VEGEQHENGKNERNKDREVRRGKEIGREGGGRMRNKRKRDNGGRAGKTFSLRPLI